MGRDNSIPKKKKIENKIFFKFLPFSYQLMKLNRVRFLNSCKVVLSFYCEEDSVSTPWTISEHSWPRNRLSLLEEKIAFTFFIILNWKGDIIWKEITNDCEFFIDINFMWRWMLIWNTMSFICENWSFRASFKYVCNNMQKLVNKTCMKFADKYFTLCTSLYLEKAIILSLFFRRGF